MKKLPTKDWKDYGHDSVTAGLNVVPLLGGAFATVFETVFSSPIDKRKEAWLQELANTVDDLCQKVDGLTPETLSKDELFISAYLQASNIAIRTHHKIKLAALQAAVKNTVLLKDYDESKKLIFIRVIDEMTPLHFKVLYFLSEPEEYISALNKQQGPNVTTQWGDLRKVWDETFKDIRASDSLIDLVVADLNRFGFVFIDKFYKASMNSSSTKTGHDFIKFISEKP